MILKTRMRSIGAVSVNRHVLCLPPAIHGKLQAILPLQAAWMLNVTTTKKAREAIVLQSEQGSSIDFSPLQ